VIERFNRDRVRLGRTTDNEVAYDPVACTTVSSHHDEVITDGSDFSIQDLGPANGTYVDGVAVRERARL